MRRRHVAAAVSVARTTVGGMTTRTTTRTTSRVHTCTYFDDGGAEHLCSCGSRAFYLTEHDGVLDGTEPVLVVLEDGSAVAGLRSRELAVPA